MLQKLQKDNLIKIKTKFDDLELYVDDMKKKRKIYISGNHVKPNGSYNCNYSELETLESMKSISLIAKHKGRHFRDEIERLENPAYMLRGLKNIINEFDLIIEQKEILDFGCGSGAFFVNLIKLGASKITGVEINKDLIDIARSRLNNFDPEKYSINKIKYINEKNKMSFQENKFDIVWAHAVLEHVFPKERKYVLNDLWRVTKNGGILILDALPNRLWIREIHTTGLLFVNYLPLSLACSIARHFSEKVPNDQSVEKLLERGFRGATYWDIKKILPDAIWLNNLNRKADLNAYMKTWLKEEDNFSKKFIKKLYGMIMSSFDPFLSLIKLPQTAFLPWHFIVLKKQ